MRYRGTDRCFMDTFQSLFTAPAHPRSSCALDHRLQHCCLLVTQKNLLLTPSRGVSSETPTVSPSPRALPCTCTEVHLKERGTQQVGLEKLVEVT